MFVESAQPYQSLAGIYDHVMRHVDYDNWAAYIRDLCQRFEMRPGGVVDLACGTGNVSLELCALELPVEMGIDLSEAMLQQAREKAVRAGLQIDFRQGDLRRLEEHGPFDLAVCMYDSFNYLLSLEEFTRAVEGVHRMLAPDGLFIFDVCTEQNSQRYFREVRDLEIGPGFSYERHSYYDEEERLQVNDFVIHIEGREEPFEEHHVQRIYPVAEIVDLLKKGPFELLDAFDGFTFKKGTERSDRIHFALRRPRA